MCRGGRKSRSEVTLHQILVHMIAETHRHAGHADIVRELIDGAVGLREGNDNMAPGDQSWWEGYRTGSSAPRARPARAGPSRARRARPASPADRCTREPSGVVRLPAFGRDRRAWHHELRVLTTMRRP